MNPYQSNKITATYTISSCIGPQSIQYLSNRIAQLQKMNQLQKQRIQQLQKQNQQLMGIVVQASHHNVNKTNQFIQKVQKIVNKKLNQSRRSSNNQTNTYVSDRCHTNNSGIKENVNNNFSIKMKTQNSARKKQKSKSKQKENKKQSQKHKNKDFKKQNLKHRQPQYLLQDWRNVNLRKQNDISNGNLIHSNSNMYAKLNKRQLMSEMQSLKRIQKKVL